MRCLEQFKPCFGHRAQLLSLRSYVQGVFSDSERKSMQAMLARVTEPVAYWTFQHFITHAPWDADRVWRRLRAVLPQRHGIFILDGTSFPKQENASVGVAPILWCARQDRKLPGRGHSCAVDGRAGVVSRGRSGVARALAGGWCAPSCRSPYAPGNLYCAAVCRRTALNELDGTGETRTLTTDLTKPN